MIGYPPYHEFKYMMHSNVIKNYPTTTNKKIMSNKILVLEVYSLKRQVMIKTGNCYK